MTGDRPNRVQAGVRRWPLMLIAAPAAVSIWSGWVGLGSLCGFGLVTPLPGIADGFRINTAITLPVGVEAYGAYALGAWITPGVPGRARAFARRSAVGALALGMAGQVIYHLLAAAHAARAPWPVTVLVACMPVITLGFGTALTHLLRTRDDADEHTPEGNGAEGDASGPAPVAYPAVPWPRPSGLPAPAPVLPAPAPGPKPLPSAPANGTRPTHPSASDRGHVNGAPGHTRTRKTARTPARTRGAVSADAAEVHFAAVLAEGRHPSMRRVKAELRTGQDRATQIHDQLAAVAPEPDGHTCRCARTGRPA